MLRFKNPKPQVKRIRVAPLLQWLVAISAIAAGPAFAALPTGGQFNQGAGTIATGTNAVNVNVTGAVNSVARIDWASFNLSAGNSANFHNGTGASTVNIVNVDNQGAMSQINGTIHGTGSGTNILLVNPNGISMGSSARVDTTGSFVAAAGTVEPSRVGSVTLTLNNAPVVMNAAVSTGASVYIGSHEAVSMHTSGNDATLPAMVGDFVFAQVQGTGTVRGGEGVRATGTVHLSAPDAHMHLTAPVSGEALVVASKGVTADGHQNVRSMRLHSTDGSILVSHMGLSDHATGLAITHEGTGSVRVNNVQVASLDVHAQGALSVSNASVLGNTYIRSASDVRLEGVTTGFGAYGPVVDMASLPALDVQAAGSVALNSVSVNGDLIVNAKDVTVSGTLDPFNTAGALTGTDRVVATGNVTMHASNSIRSEGSDTGMLYRHGITAGAHVDLTAGGSIDLGSVYSMSQGINLVAGADIALGDGYQGGGAVTYAAQGHTHVNITAGKDVHLNQGAHLGARGAGSSSIAVTSRGGSVTLAGNVVGGFEQFGYVDEAGRWIYHSNPVFRPVDASVQIQAAGDLVLESTANIHTGTSQPVILSAGQNFINRAGPNVLNTPYATWQIYSKDPNTIQTGGLIGEFELGSCTFGGGAVCGNTGRYSIPSAHRGFLYASSLEEPFGSPPIVDIVVISIPTISYPMPPTLGEGVDVLVKPPLPMPVPPQTDVDFLVKPPLPFPMPGVYMDILLKPPVPMPVAPETFILSRTETIR